MVDRPCTVLVPLGPQMGSSSGQQMDVRSTSGLSLT